MIFLFQLALDRDFFFILGGQVFCKVMTGTLKALFALVCLFNRYILIAVQTNMTKIAAQINE